MTLPQSYLGIDIARSRLDVFDETLGPLAPVANDPAAITAFLESLSDRRVSVVFEATGAYDRPLRAALEAAAIPFARVNPGRARDFARAAGYLAKTDAVDARMLAAMGRAIAMPPAEPVDPIREQLGALSRQCDRLVAIRAEEKTRSLQAADPQAKASMARHIAWLTREIRTIEKAIAALVAATPELRHIKSLLETAPGVGPVTAVTLIAHMPELGQRSPKAIAALAGLAPINNDSGDRRGRRAIRGGRRRVRKALYMAALSAIRAVPRFARAYADIAKRAASRKVAVIAIARRLLVALNAMIAKRQPFAP